MKRVDLRDSEVDGHFPPEKERIDGSKNCWCSWVLGLLKQCRRQEGVFGECRMTRWRKSTEEGTIYRVKMGRGISDLSLRHIRENRGRSGRYGNYSHDNQGIVRLIWRQAVMILGDVSLCKISWSAHRQSVLTKTLPMNVYWGDSVREVEKFCWSLGNQFKISLILRLYLHRMCNREFNFEALFPKNKSWTTQLPWTHSRGHMWFDKSFIGTVQILHGSNRRIHTMVSCVSAIDMKPCFCQNNCASYQTQSTTS